MIAVLSSYTVLASIVILTSAGAALGAGLAGNYLLEAIKRAPAVKDALLRAFIIGAALIETGAILGVIITLLLLRVFPDQAHSFACFTLSVLGIVASLGIVGLTVGICSSYCLKQALYALTRQPLFSHKIIGLMVLTQTILQTPLIFAFIVSLIIYNGIGHDLALSAAIKFFAGGCCIGIGSIGPLIGLMYFTQAALYALAYNKDSYQRVLTFSFISQAIIETPIIFALLIALVLVFFPSNSRSDLYNCVIYLTAGLVMAIGTIGAGISSGKTAAGACKGLVHQQVDMSLLTRTSIIAQGIIDAVAIYVFLIALMLLLLS